MSEQESSSAKAGRFVRAAGLAVGATARELNKSVQESREAPATPAVPAEPVAPVAPPPPAPNTGGLVGRLVFYGFIASVVAFVLVLLRAESLLGTGEVRTVFRVLIAGALFGEALLLLTNWRGANERLGQRLLAKIWGPRGPVTRRERVFARVIRDGITLIAILWLAAGVFDILTSFVSA